VALEGERKQVTVLFADLKGSMEIVGHGVEEARSVLDGVLERMMEAVHRFEGTVNQVMGDGIMALFGAPVAHEDHAVRGCYAALRMQQAITEYAAEVVRRLGIPIEARIGLNSGDVIVRTIRSDLRMDYTAVGHTTHLAARMEQMARPGSILVTTNVVVLAAGFVEVRAIGSVPVKGMTQPIVVHELVAATPVTTRLQASAARGLTRFVGRRMELDVLDSAQVRAGAGHGQVVALVGEPGVGKSRLLREFLESAQVDSDWRVLESSAISFGTTTPYLAIIEMLRRYFQLEAGDDDDTVARKVATRITGLDAALTSPVAPLLSLMDVRSSDPEWCALDAVQRRHRVMDAVKRLLIRESQARPLVVVFEDLHWIDPSSQTVLDALVESVPAARMLILVSFRPEYQHGWSSKSYYSQIRIDPLPPDSVEAMLAASLGSDPDLGALKARLIERTEGNPFFLEESVQTLVEAGVLGGAPGARRLLQQVDDVRMPATVQALLASRIDRLAPNVKRLLQCASVVGRDVPYPLLVQIAGQDEDVVRQGLNDLQTREYLYEARLFPEVEYTFKHALTHDVAYASLARERRRDLHVSIMRFLERLPDDNRAEHVDQLGHHAFHGEVWSKAVTYLRDTGLRAMGRVALREASAAFEQALRALSRCPDEADRVEEAIDLRLALRNALGPLAEFECIRVCLDELEPLVEQLGDPARLGRYYNSKAAYLYLTVDHERAVEAGRRALTFAADDFALEILANLTVARATHELPDYAEAERLMRRNIAALAGPLAYERFGDTIAPAVSSRQWLAWAIAWRGEFTEAASIAADALRLASELDHGPSSASAHMAVGLPAIVRGDTAVAIPALERAIALFRSSGHRTPLPASLSFLAYGHTLNGRYAEAIALFEESLALAARIRFLPCNSLWTAWYAEAHLRSGDVEQAMRTGRRAYEISLAQKELGYHAYAARILGETAAAAGDDPHAYFAQARDLAASFGMRPLVAQCGLGLGAWHRRRDEQDQSRNLLTRAVGEFRTLGMPVWLGHGQAEIAKLG
jgi:class 3 adenylate cyclase/tetratricopeptide (TPR) repeat protein